METYDGNGRSAEGPWYTSLWVLLVVILGIALLVAWATAQRGPTRLASERRQIVVAPQGPPGYGRRGPGRARGPHSRGAPGDQVGRSESPPVSDI
jgi:hypothetical protein